jgi:opacity protein-like surface antigen
MKSTLLLSLFLAIPAFAGSSHVTTTESSPPPPAEDTWSFFAGGTAGYLFEFDEDIYTLQLGAKSPWSVAGWSVALFAEAGWTENHEDLEGAPALAGDEDADLDIVPLTFNVKLERLISGGLSVYAGGGLGASYVDAEIDSLSGDDDSADDWVFTAQAFAGLAYHVNDSLELFGGGRWIYFEDPSFRGVDLGDDWLLEAGLRYHF